MPEQLTVGFGGGDPSCRTRGDKFGHPHVREFPTLSVSTAVQKAMETGSFVSVQNAWLLLRPLPPVSLPIT